MKTLMKALAASALLCAAMPATATEYIFTTTGNSAVNGTYGNARTFTSNAGGAQVRVTGWQASSTNVITSAFLGAYGGGLGVTGLGDQNGANEYHQVDNAGGYTDFLFFQFDRAVNLTSVFLNAYGLPNYSDDSDLLFRTTSIAGAWNSSINLGLYSYGGPFGENTSDVGTRTATLGSNEFSTQWLIAAGVGSNLDGFKLSQLKVNTSAVPEPGTWAMMLIGFGAVGASMRKRRKVMTLQAA